MKKKKLQRRVMALWARIESSEAHIEDLEARVAALEVARLYSPSPFVWRDSSTYTVTTPVPYETTTVPNALPLVEVS